MKRANYDTARPYIASFVIFKQNGKVAFLLRSNTDWMKGFYGLPSGKVENDESFLQAAIREAKEEVGTDLKPDQLAYVHTEHRKGDDSEWVDVFFEAKNWNGNLKNAEPHIHSELAWLDPARLPDNVIPHVKAALEHMQDGGVYSEYGWEEA